jgi:uncharacterized protein
MLELGLAMASAFLASILSAVAGFGGAALLLPLFVALFGVRDAVVVLTVVQLMSNGSRVWFNRRQVEGRIVGWFALGAVPAAVAGGLVFATAPLSALTRSVGVVLLLLVGWRRLKPSALHPTLPAFAAIGAVSGFGSALVGSLGPLTAPFFLGRGLVKGAYIGTEAASALVMHAVKIVVYGGMAVASASAVATGIALTPATWLGVRVGSHIVDRLPQAVFIAVVETALVVAGVLLIAGV